MNRDDTVELFRKGREEWNDRAKALLAERKAMEAEHNWKSHRPPPMEREEGANPETQAWLDKAFVNFSRCEFLVQGADGTKETAGEDQKEGVDNDLPVKPIQLETDHIDFDDFIFPSDTSFDRATFKGVAKFERATFTGNAWFDRAIFGGYANFKSAILQYHASFYLAYFKGNASFEETAFGRKAWFHSTSFGGEIRFDSAIFKGPSQFTGTTFARDASFKGTTFARDASFKGTTFERYASFDSTTFTGEAFFYEAKFTGNASFEKAILTGNASFVRVTFENDISFNHAIFANTALFTRAVFTDNALFEEMEFAQMADFGLANFKQYASFKSSRFEGKENASFEAIRGEKGFNMKSAAFEAVPSFIQAHFEEAPRLDNLKVFGRWVERHPRPERKAPSKAPKGEKQQESKWRKCWYEARHVGGRVRTWPLRAMRGAWQRVREGEADMPARWRALKRLAIEGQDTERELEYHACELRSQRFESDWPVPYQRQQVQGASRSDAKCDWALPFVFLSPASWVGFSRFWSGLFYGLFSDFGRSIFRPFLLWWATVAVFAMYFLSGQPGVALRWQAGGSQGAGALVVAYVQFVPKLWREPPPCFNGEPLSKEGKLEAGKRYGLDAAMAGSTNALAEAFRLAIRNGSIFLDGGDDSARRTYGCLYGIQNYGGGPAPFVPGFVTDASGIQKVLSALYIFLFGLALRNMLKMK
jgi:hypothetical protein